MGGMINKPGEQIICGDDSVRGGRRRRGEATGENGIDEIYNGLANEFKGK